MTTITNLEVASTQRRGVPRRTRFDFWLDLVLFLAFTIDFNLEFTGLAVHEWLGAMFGISLVVHLVSHWDWVMKTTRKVLGAHPIKERIKWAVDLLLMVLMAWTVASGIIISAHLLPALGFTGSKDSFFRNLHSVAADISVVAVGIHIALSWSWVMSVGRRVFRSNRTPVRARESS